MDESLDRVQYLVASKNRVRVLEYLRKAPADREELSEQLGIPRSTLSRVLTGLEEQNWISQHGSDCKSTALGAFLAEEFSSLMDAVETMQRLEDVIDYLPMDEIDFDLIHLRDARITTPTRTDPGAPLRRARELLHEADEFVFLTNTVVSPLVETLQERTVQGDLAIVGVITGELLDAVSDSPAFREPTRDMIESGGAEFYRYDGTVPRTLGVADETIAAITQIDRDGHQHAQIETDDRHVCSWVMSTIEEHRRQSEQISASTFTE
jgi:predicted transcriptional regulator